MNTKIIERTLTPTICTFYLLMCCLLAATAEGKTVIDIWGGFVPSGGLLSNVIGIVRWNICVMPPVMVSNLFMIVETGKLSTFTVIRETSLEKWFYKRYIAMVISSFTYIALAIILTTFLGFNKSLQLHQFFSFALLFSAHILLLISASVATLLIFRSAKVVLILYLIIEGIMVIIGTTFPVTSKYLIPYWGMAIEDQTMTVAWKTVLSLLITALSVLITIVFLKKHNPTETPKNT